MGAYITSRQVTVASIVANVHAQPAVKLLEPSDEDNAEKLFLKAQHKLDKAGNRDNDDNEGREGDVEGYRGRIESPDRHAQGRRGRRNRREEPR